MDAWPNPQWLLDWDPLQFRGLNKYWRLSSPGSTKSNELAVWCKHVVVLVLSSILSSILSIILSSILVCARSATVEFFQNAIESVLAFHPRGVWPDGMHRNNQN